MNPEELQDKYKEELQRQQIELTKKKMLFKYLEKKARERLNRVRTVKPQLAERVEMALIQAVQTGQIRGQVSDTQLKRILEEVLSEKKNFRIKRK